MTLKTLAFACAATLAISGVAAARELYDDAFFVRANATAQDLFKDRAECRGTADHMRDTAAFYSNPQYGALSAMGSALDEDSLHDGGLQRRLHRAVFDDCMRHKGWTAADVTPEELKVLLKADMRHPEALDAWLKAHAPPPALLQPSEAASKASEAPSAASTPAAVSRANN